jgi:hypothetical protein
MYITHDAGKMVIKYNSPYKSEMSGTSDIGHRTSNLFEVEFWVSGKEEDNHNEKL